MERIDGSLFLIKAYLDEKLREINDSFYYDVKRTKNIQDFIERFQVFIGNRDLENKLPYIFPEDKHICEATIIKNELKIGFRQGFYIGNGDEKEGEEWKRETDLSSCKRVITLSEEIGKILSPGKNLNIIDGRYKINGFVEPYLVHIFQNGDYVFSKLELGWNIEKNLEFSDFQINLKIFYEFFKDLK